MPAASSKERSPSPTTTPAWRFNWVVLALGALLVITTAQTSSAAAKRLVTPPDGWTSYAVPENWKKTNLIELYAEPNPDGVFTQSINVLAAPTVEDAPTIAKALASFYDPHFAEAKQATFPCAGSSAVDLREGSRDALGRETVFNQIVTVHGGMEYVVSYMRLETQPEIPAALEAIKSICANLN